MKKKILVVDDDPNILDYLESLFSDNGYDVVAARDAKEGLEMAKKDVPDLITLDIEMPGDWGPRFYRQMIQEPGLKNVPVIVISGLSGNAYAIPKAIASLKKPFDREELLGIVKDAIG
ncbi:MAG: response regulator [Proteobacteria bacterium]|nr:response regulator [Pseudomonadota bacterium]MBU1386781.1 response regulator [Pseudomonadota bacterium]MBU1544725.1 response regulator [Pseudomonadota bacterium]MBU2429674.1 response regulator [Pseudomonadota bacterium]MBU2481856.1 response regulator [Pseudomonadota bacterium]